MSQATFDEVLEAIEHLPVDEQAELINVVRKRLAERGRARVLDDVREGRAAFDRGEASPASVADILREIES